MRKKQKQPTTRKQRRIKAKRRRRRLNRRPAGKRMAMFRRDMGHLANGFPETCRAIDEMGKALGLLKLSASVLSATRRAMEINKSTLTNES